MNAKPAVSIAPVTLVTDGFDAVGPLIKSKNAFSSSFSPGCTFPVLLESVLASSLDSN